MNAGAPSTGRGEGLHQRPQGRPLTGAPVPAGLVIAAAWCWRILIVAGAFLALVTLFNRLYLVVLPVFALLLAAPLLPLLALLRRLHLPQALAPWGTVIIAFAVLGGIGLLSPGFRWGSSYLVSSS